MHRKPDSSSPSIVINEQEVERISKIPRLLPNKSLDKIPLMGFGTFDVERPEIILTALEIGYRHLDLAENYHNLPILKTALEIAFLSVEFGGLGISREEIWITMKVFQLENEEELNSLIHAVGCEYFDLLLVHYPHGMFDSSMSCFSKWQKFCDFPGRLVRKVGVSNFYVPHLNLLLTICSETGLKKPYANQIQLNPYVFSQEKDVLELCASHNIQLIAYSPLGFKAFEIIMSDPKLNEIAKTLGILPEQVTLAWLMSKQICVIPKSSHRVRQQLNFDSTLEVSRVLHFSDEISKISSDDISRGDIFLLDSAFTAKEFGRKLEQKGWLGSKTYSNTQEPDETALATKQDKSEQDNNNKAHENGESDA